MNLTHHSIELRGAARYATTALSIVLIGGACTSALAFRQQVAAPQTPTTTAPSTVNIGTPASDQGAPSTVNLAVPASDLKNAPSVVNIAPAPTGNGPSTVTFAFPRPTVGQPAPSVKVDIADASSPNPVVKVLTNVVVEPIQTNIQTSTVSTIQVRPGDIAGNRDKFVEPIYPPDAKAAGIQGSVVLDAVIGKDGNIASLKLVSGPPELTKAAWEAVKQWTYKPYLLNGDPIAVETTITVTFAFAK